MRFFRLWPPLFLTPVAFLAVLSIAYALLPWACENQRVFPLHLAILTCLAITVAGVTLAWRDWRDAGVQEPDDKSDDIAQVRFIAVLGLMLSGLMTLTTLGLWLPTLLISPCAL